MKKHLIIAALATAGLAVTGCRSYDTDAREGQKASVVNDDRRAVDLNKSNDGLNRTDTAVDHDGYNAVDNEPGTGGSGAEGGSGTNAVSKDPNWNRGEDLNDTDREPVRSGHRNVNDKDMPPTDGKLQIILK